MLRKKSYSLFDRPTPAYSLPPDIVFRHNERTIVVDTKGLLLSTTDRNHGILQFDMDQMYAYGKKYDAEKILLLYPLVQGSGDEKIVFESYDGMTVEIAFVDWLTT
ncbi:MAG: McrC family protein [Coriobacteriales bacterium]|nr:McrC family protein [Coriobacteriales bacterium]